MPKPETCSTCHEQVRWGTRDGVGPTWLHREPVEHHVVLGHVRTAEEEAEADRQYRMQRTRTVTRTKTVGGEKIVTEHEETYSAAELDLERYRKNKKFAEAEARERADSGEDEEEDDEPVAALPPVEIWAHDVNPAEFTPRSGIRQVINLMPKQGWDLISVRHARGPYMGSKGQCLSISDTHVVKARGPVGLDGTWPWAVASWRDGKFDFAYVGVAANGQLSPRKVDATSMKNFVKGIETPA